MSGFSLLLILVAVVFAGYLLMSGRAPKIAAMFFPDKADPENERPTILLDRFSDFLPYRVFDTETSIFINNNSSGFVIEIPPLVGADERTGDLLSQFFQEGLPPKTCVQILSWGSPRIGRKLGDWFIPRYAAGSFYQTMAQYRSDLLLNGVWNSLSRDAPFHVRHHRVVVSVGVPNDANVSKTELVQVREGLIGVLKSVGADPLVWTPVELIGLVDDITSPTTASEDEASTYNELDIISDQAVRKDIEIEVEADRLKLRTERYRPVGRDKDNIPEIGEVYPDHFDVRHFGVRNMPGRWAPWETARLIGDMFTDKLRLPCPTATSLCLVYPDQEAQASKANMQALRQKSLADSKGAKFLRGIGEQAREWEDVQNKLQEGRKIVRTFYGVTTFSPAGDGDKNERLLKSVYRAAGWDLQDERFLQIQGLITSLPLTLADGGAHDLERLKRMRTMLSSTASCIAPVQGEYLGGPVPHMLLLGRRGEPFFWSPFENSSGNHNVAIMGKSGSGKSVALQELCASLAGAGAKVVVIDDGRSFQNSCALQGGEFVEFTMASGFCLNPFSMIDAEKAAASEDYKMDCIAMLKAMVGQMARFIDRLNDTERGLIDEAVNDVWNNYGREGCIDHIQAFLNNRDVHEARNIAIALTPFTSAGTYGRFFFGQASLEMSADFTVFELSDLASREELRSVVLTAIMFMTTQMMTKVPRSIKKILMIDEAWQLLRGGSMADFVEAYARTCRKYGGSLATATQSINDFYKSDGAKAALENSDWMVVLQQKPETVGDISRSGRLEMDAPTETMIRSLKRNGVEFSEMFVKGPDVQFVGRLVLDPWSAKVFSSSPADVAEIDRLQRAGFSKEDAIARVAFPEKFAEEEQEVPYAAAAE